jgi:hypothetical protein
VKPEFQNTLLGHPVILIARIHLGSSSMYHKRDSFFLDPLILKPISQRKLCPYCYVKEKHHTGKYQPSHACLLVDFTPIILFAKLNVLQKIHWMDYQPSALLLETATNLPRRTRRGIFHPQKPIPHSPFPSSDTIRPIYQSSNLYLSNIGTPCPTKPHKSSTP